MEILVEIVVLEALGDLVVVDLVLLVVHFQHPLILEVEEMVDLLVFRDLLSHMLVVGEVEAFLELLLEE
jgi:hypothetical protein